ncbi:MAG TPA: hypothetical protein VGD84_18595, partial [Pseudonocardiaceae bacterium]
MIVGSASTPVLAGVAPHAVLSGLIEQPGLVVLSGKWVGGGVVVAMNPVRTTDDDVSLAEVLDSTIAREAGPGEQG